MNDLNGTVTESLKAYYTKTEVDTKVKELNTAISGIDSLKNLKVEYDNTTGNLVFKDGTEPIGEPITINSLATLLENPMEIPTDSGPIKITLLLLFQYQITLTGIMVDTRLMLLETSISV